jgi:ferric-chelate reductase [NAD(P)H]
MIDENPDKSAIDYSSLRKMGYGLYVITSMKDHRTNGQLANTVFQLTNEPAKIAISVSKTNLTHEFIMSSLRFAVSVIAETAPLTFIGLFGFRSGRDIDKLSKVFFKKGMGGCPIVIENCVSFMEAVVVDRIDVGTHTLFIGELINAELINDTRSMSYAYYQENLKGKTPKASPTFIPPTEIK